MSSKKHLSHINGTLPHQACEANKLQLSCGERFGKGTFGAKQGPDSMSNCGVLNGRPKLSHFSK